MRQELINLLPNDIILKIISYTYNPQSKQLLQDILSFNETKLKLFSQIFVLNYNWQITRYNWYEINNLHVDYISNLVDELLIFMYSKVNGQNIYNYLSQRSYKYKTREQVNNCINNIKKKDYKTQINILWGVLKPFERKIFIDKLNIYYG